jgi:hypothetical protein
VTPRSRRRTPLARIALYFTARDWQEWISEFTRTITAVPRDVQLEHGPEKEVIPP